MENKILVVVDMQNDFIDGVLGSEEARAIVPKVVEKIKKWDGFIISTRDIHDDQTYYSTQEGNSIPLHCERDKNGSLLNEEVSNALRGKFRYPFQKKSFGSFSLAQHLKLENDFNDVTLIGLCTDICVISNAILLQSVGKRVTIDAACCAGSTPENHEAALKVMKACCMDIENWGG